MSDRRLVRCPPILGWAVGSLTLLLVTGSCSSATSSTDLSSLACTIPTEFIADGGPGKDGIPALLNPLLVAPGAPGAAYLRDEDRVVGVAIGEEFLAVPLNIGWWHEVVNLDRGTLRLSVTHCPLTGSSLVFDRSAAGGATFGVSGLLYLNNLMLYDRNGDESLWPQMSRGARCGTRAGTPLPLYPSVEMTWAAWRELHPTTTVVASATGHNRDYQLYPYGNYAEPSNPQLLSPIPRLDARRLPKERVLGLVTADGAAVALPFAELRKLGARAAVRVRLGSEEAIVLWEAAGEGAAAFRPVVAGRTLTFDVVDGTITDRETGSQWRVDGRATAGPLAGEHLPFLADNFVAYWFAWAAFHPSTQLWEAP